ncbi:TPA: ArpU family phage packaging/lysis transcriptional regulator [Bacillus cereus]|uniref:ArpU family phage packaging/lysis transcriptional regulator n=1 Tax=Sphingobacterium tenebrionis TaxID=3111775 RepID=A0ABU8IB51_9SPHI|nr:MULTISPECIES: ArpU family phage packaging/lysis transcriptional regulator [Bacillus cereus group]MBL3768293.1 ArpU family transcriptional regulator [Bacillus cereus]MBL3774272.1 ArpU family transcriptional regulator [Bacillus cereus]MBL3780042.1 ArpU family transcriptional regulator [Bacillus cereus]MBL3791181.1 ArpU family transcriptional regulator [Bacillus cereus]USL05466.1 ArpU family transcriptional regulator [Bacillus anthracis]
MSVNETGRIGRVRKKKSISSMLKEIDRDATKEAVEAELYQYKMYMYEMEEENLPKITPNFSIAPPTFSNAFHSSTEDTVIRNMEENDKRTKFMGRIMRAVNRLSKRERTLIVKKYLDFEDYIDKEIYEDFLDVSERTFYNIQSDAFYKLAVNLRKLKYLKKDESTPN